MKDLWVPISGAIAQQKQVETIANNVANANTPGFKKDKLVFREYLSKYEKGAGINLPNKEWSPEDFYHTHGAEKAMVKIDGGYAKHRQGQITATGNPLDLAINGSGFFEVLTPNGVRYTRKGVFGLDSGGRLVTGDGHPVLGYQKTPPSDNQNPSRRIITVPGGRISIDQHGQIASDQGPVDKLNIVDFKNVHKLKKEGNSFFINSDGNNILADKTSKVLQGFVEQSNVNAIEEMSDLIKAHRQFESLQRVIKAYDEIAGKANEIPRF